MISSRILHSRIAHTLLLWYVHLEAAIESQVRPLPFRVLMWVEETIFIEPINCFRTGGKDFPDTECTRFASHLVLYRIVA